MIAELRAATFLRFETMLASVIEAAARAFGAAPFAVCCVDLGDVDGRRFALTLHAASPAQLDPANFTGESAHSAPLWCRAAPVAVIAPVAAAVLGAEMGAAVESTHATGAVPVVIVADGAAIVAAFDRPPGAS
jgi:hypothetical protein